MKIVLRLFLAVATRAFWAIGGDDNFGRQFWATILIINWVATAVLSGPRLGSEALVRCSLRDEQLVPPPPVRKLPCLASQGKYQPQQVIFKMNIEAAVSTKRLHRQMAQGSK